MTQYYFLYRFGQWLALTLPIGFSYKLAEVFSDLHSCFSGQDRRDVALNLKTIFPQKSPKEIRKIRRQMKRNFGKYLVDFFRFSLIDREYIKKHVRIENICYVHEALALGNGVIALSAHVGNWELAGVVTALSGFDLWAVALEHKNKKVNEFFNRQRETKGMYVIPLSIAVRQCLGVLRKNKVLALVGDRDFQGSGIEVDFFGKPAKLPLGPAVLSLKTGSPIVPGFLVREGRRDNYKLVFEKPIIHSLTGDHQKDIRELVLAGKTVLEKYISMYPDQWFVFRRFWI